MTITVRGIILLVHDPVDQGYVPDARALFERVIPMFSAERARPLWERWARYEYQFGDLEAAQKLEKRIAEVYPTGAFRSDAFANTDGVDGPFHRSSDQTLCAATHISRYRCYCGERPWICYGGSSASRSLVFYFVP